MKLINRINKSAGKNLYFHFGFMNFAATATVIYFFIRFSLRNGIIPFTFSFQSAIEIVLSLISINLLVLIIDLAAGYRYIIRTVLQVLLFFLLWLSNTYYLTTHVPADFSMIADNIGLAFSTESGMVIWSSFQMNHIVAAVLFAAAALMLEIRFRLISGFTEFQYRIPKLAVSVIVYIVIVVIPVQSYDQITALAQDAYHRIFPDPRTRKVVNGYPYMKESAEISNMFSYSGRKRPDIYLVMIESYNANYVEARTPDGREITPVLNSLIRRGVYYDRFYANSIQTCKGQATVLLSVTPSIKGKIFTDYPNLKFKALPSYLGDEGYDTVFMQAGENLSFDNTGRFMKRAGFAESRSAYEFLSSDEISSIWGWGPEDSLFYKTFFKYLDRRRQENGNRPVFAMLATISNHMRFDSLPDNKKLLYPHPVNIEQNYSNSIHLSDSHLQVLIDQISSRQSADDAIIIITGDHSFPMNEHGYIHNENGFYDESFRIPFLILYGSMLKPQRISDRAFSQLDIAPTILDLAGIRIKANSFTGNSLFLKGKSPQPIHLVQPYNGAYLQSLRFPYKYIFHRKTGNEYVFNLIQDPGETENLITKIPQDLYSTLKNDIDRLYVNQQILDSNLLYNGEITSGIKQ